MTSSPAAMRLISIHGFDPRGPKVGGIETHVRQLLKDHPANMRAMIIGIDDFGDLELGKLHVIEVAGREIDFVPVLHVPSTEQTGAAKSIASSTTFRFTAALLRHLPALRRLIRGQAAVVEIERFEYALVAKALGCPFTVICHNEGDPRTDKMDSILSNYWYLNSVAERIAVTLASGVWGVTPKIRERLAAKYPRHADKMGVLTVSVDTGLFHATPFDLSADKLRIIYAGRLDEFKDPPLMFRVMKRLHERLDGALEFHYCGSADPHRFPEFAPIEGFTVRHGALSPNQVAEVMRQVHMGTLVSYWEGMPCFLLELLASGRPFGGLRLPQFDQVVEQGVSGRMVERQETVEQSVELVCDTIITLWKDIQEGRIDPARVHEHILPWSIEQQLSRLFQSLQGMARPGRSVDGAGVGAAATA